MKTIEQVQEQCRVACGYISPETPPSDGHDWIDELCGLYRVMRLQRDDARNEVTRLQNRIDWIRKQAAEARIILSGTTCADGQDKLMFQATKHLDQIMHADFRRTAEDDQTLATLGRMADGCRNKASARALEPKVRRSKNYVNP